MEDDIATPFDPIDHPLVEYFCRIVVLFSGSTYKVKLRFEWFYPYRSDDQVTFIQLHCLPIIKTNKDKLSTELNTTDHLSHVRNHKRTKTNDDIEYHYLHCSVPVPFFSRWLRTISRFSSVPEPWLWSLVIRHGSKSKNSSTKWQSRWRILELNSKIILFLPIDRIHDQVLIIYSDCWVVCLFISPLVPLRP